MLKSLSSRLGEGELHRQSCGFCYRGKCSARCSESHRAIVGTSPLGRKLQCQHWYVNVVGAPSPALSGMQNLALPALFARGSAQNSAFHPRPGPRVLTRELSPFSAFWDRSDRFRSIGRLALDPETLERSYVHQAKLSFRQHGGFLRVLDLPRGPIRCPE